MPASVKHLTDKKLNLTSLLARWKDGLYYTAAIVKCDKLNKKCLVCFEDGSEVWVDNRDVHIQLTLDQLGEDEDIVCCICDDGCSEPPNEIIICDVCQQGYHQKCHNPPVDSSKIDESDDTNEHKDWFCATCSYILNQSDRAKLSANAQALQKQSEQAQPSARHQTKTPVSQTVSRQPPKVKHTPVGQQKHHSAGPVRLSTNSQHRQQPYNPLSNQVRIAATSSTAALASMTASSALVVGSSAGRSKQDLVNQSNKSSQRQRQTVISTIEVVAPSIKHAVRKSSVNFVSPLSRQSALPTATRSPLPTLAPAVVKLPESAKQNLVTPARVTITPSSSTITMNQSPMLVKTPSSITSSCVKSVTSSPGDRMISNIDGDKNITQTPHSNATTTSTGPSVSIFSKLVNWTGEPQVTVAPPSLVKASSTVIKATIPADKNEVKTDLDAKESQKSTNSVGSDTGGNQASEVTVCSSSATTKNNGDNFPLSSS